MRVKKEGHLIKRALLLLSDFVLFRNNSGNFWAGRSILTATRSGMVHVERGDVVLRGARRVNAGLEVGSGDLIGWREITIGSSDVGRRVAVFASVEIKSKNDRVAPHQKKWRDTVTAAGGEAYILKEGEGL